MINYTVLEKNVKRLLEQATDEFMAVERNEGISTPEDRSSFIRGISISLEALRSRASKRNGGGSDA